MLQRFHCQVVGVRNGEEGMRAIQEQGPFQMVFMDIHMPVMDGFATTRAIRQLDPPMGDVAIVAITAYTTRDDSERYVQAVRSSFFGFLAFCARVCLSSSLAQLGVSCLFPPLVSFIPYPFLFARP